MFDRRDEDDWTVNLECQSCLCHVLAFPPIKPSVSLVQRRLPSTLELQVDSLRNGDRAANAAGHRAIALR